MNEQTKRPNRRQIKERLKLFWADWKPNISELGSAVIVVAIGTICGLAAYYYTMAWSLWACLLATAAAVILGTSLTLTFVEQAQRYSKQRAIDKAAKVDSDKPITGVSIVKPTAAPAGT